MWWQGSLAYVVLLVCTVPANVVAALLLGALLLDQMSSGVRACHRTRRMALNGLVEPLVSRRSGLPLVERRDLRDLAPMWPTASAEFHGCSWIEARGIRVAHIVESRAMGSPA